MFYSNNDSNLTDIGSRIKIAREKFGLSRGKFSEIIGVSPYYLGQIERGERGMSINTLIKISDGLNISTDYILRGHIRHQEPLILEEFESDYISEYSSELKELLYLLKGSSKLQISLIKDMSKLLLPYIK